jgi:hypothetical protein
VRNHGSIEEKPDFNYISGVAEEAALAHLAAQQPINALEKQK